MRVADTAAAFAEADERLYGRELENASRQHATASKELRATRRDVRAAVIERLRGGDRETLRAARQARSEARALVRGTRRELRELHGQRELRGHEVEWLSVILQAGEFTTPLPGYGREEIDSTEGRFRQGADAPTIDETRDVVPGAVPQTTLHTHPITGDPAQAPTLGERRSAAVGEGSRRRRTDWTPRIPLQSQRRGDRVWSQRGHADDQSGTARGTNSRRTRAR